MENKELEKNDASLELEEEALTGVTGGENVEVRIEDSPLGFVVSHEEDIKQGNTVG